MHKLIASLAAGALLALPVVARADTSPVPAARKIVPPVHVAAAKKETHPKIRAAIKALQNAKVEMQNAAHDYGGHRVEAIKAVDEALRQLNLALNYDKK
jgi:hypothetical protein